MSVNNLVGLISVSQRSILISIPALMLASGLCVYTQVIGWPPVEVSIVILSLIVGYCILSRLGEGPFLAYNWIVVYIGLTMLVRGIFVYLVRSPEYHAVEVFGDSSLLDQYLSRGLIVVMIGLVCFILGYGLKFGGDTRGLLRRTDVFREGVIYFKRPIVVVITAVIFCLIEFEVRASRSVTDGGDFILYVPTYFVMGYASVCAYAFGAGRCRQTSLFHSLIAIGFFRALLLGSKMMAIVMLLFGAIGYLSRPKKVCNKLVMVVASIIVILCVFGSSNRTKNDTLYDGASLGFERIVSRSYGIDSVMAVDSYLNSGGSYLWRENSVTLLAGWVPRQAWPDKPKSFSVLFGQKVFPMSSLSGVSFFAPSVIGELYITVGLFGVAFGMFMYGALTSWVDGLAADWRRVLLFLPLLHIVEGSVVAQVYMAAPALLSAILIKSYDTNSIPNRGQ